MNTQYEIAKIITKNSISDEVIDNELSSFEQRELDQLCILLDEKIKEIVNNYKKDVQEKALSKELNSIAKNNKVSTTALWIAYLKWADMEYEIKK